MAWKALDIERLRYISSDIALAVRLNANRYTLESIVSLPSQRTPLEVFEHFDKGFETSAKWVRFNGTG